MDNRTTNFLTSSFNSADYDILYETVRSYFTNGEDIITSMTPQEISEELMGHSDENGHQSSIEHITRHMCDGVKYTYATLLSKSATLAFLATCIKTKDLNTLRIVIVCEQANEAIQLTNELGKRSIGCLLLNEPTHLIESALCLWNNRLLSSVLVVCDYVLPHVANIIRLGVNFVINSTYPLPHVFQKRLELLIPTPPNGTQVLVIGSRCDTRAIWQLNQLRASQAITSPTTSFENWSRVSLENVEEPDAVPESNDLAQNLSYCISSNSINQFVPKIEENLNNFVRDNGHIYTYNQFGVFAWSRLAQFSCYNIKDVVGLEPKIKQGMQSMNICQSRARCVQRFGWPHTANGRSLFIVANELTGKTLCYLPALCQRVLRNARTRKSFYAPSCIIVCANAKQCVQIGRMCQNILSKTGLKLRELITIYNRIDMNIAKCMKRSCGILITTLELLCHLLQSETSGAPIIKVKAVKCIAIDDIDGMWRASMNYCQKLKQWIADIQSRTQLQLFVVGRFWIDGFMRPLLQIFPDLLLVFEDALEAAVFLRIRLELRTSPTNLYNQNIIELIEERKEESVVVVFQKKSEACMLSNLLRLQNIDNNIIDNVDGQSEQAYLAWLRETKHRILLVIDDVLPKLHIGNVNCLFHYGYNSWPRFKARFTLFYSNYQDQSLVNKGTSVVIVRPEDEKQTWFLCDFSLKHGNDPPINYINMLTTHRMKLESNQPRPNIPLCQQLMFYGNCTRYDCQYRHFLRNYEAEPAQRLPKEGEIKFYAISSVTPAQTTAVFIENKICSFFYNLPLTKLTQSIQKYYKNSSNHLKAHNPNVGEVCVVQLNKLYQRVTVAAYDSQNHARVKQLDAGTKFYVVYTSELLVCANDFKNAPFQAVDLRILGLTPFNMERIWSENDKKLVRHKFFKYQQGEPRSVYTATIEFTFHEIIFVNDVIDNEGRSLKSFVMSNIPQYMSENVEKLLEASISEAAT